jgi:hypothetical protein
MGGGKGMLGDSANCKKLAELGEEKGLPLASSTSNKREAYLAFERLKWHLNGLFQRLITVPWINIVSLQYRTIR